MDIFGSEQNLDQWYDRHEQERLDEEYESVCAYMAKRGLTGKAGDPLPNAISYGCAEIINDDLYAFQKRIREHAYAMAMEKITS